MPFSITCRGWDELTTAERRFFVGDRYLPLPSTHAERICLADRVDATRLDHWVFQTIPPQWPELPQPYFRHEETRSLLGVWGDPSAVQGVRHWLYERSIPFDCTVYLLYERDRIVLTTWGLLVRYWDAFAGAVGYSMVAVDHTLQWAACFHHEDLLVFGSNREPG